MQTRIFLAIIPVIFILAIGCSSATDDAITPPETTAVTGPTSQASSHHMLGLWQFIADRDNETLEIIQLRTGDFHLNALPFLEPPPFLNLSLESLEFIGNTIEADIGLRHPFLGLTEFTGFDVCGIFITEGSISGFDDPHIVMAGEGDTYLMNPDGWSRWWNPAEFPVNTGTMFSYKDGLLGTADAVGNYNSTINAYKYFADELEPNDALDILSLEKRGMFAAGSKNVRHYSIDLGAGLIFNYAIDANWEFPTGDKPWVIPDDFSENANRPEAYRITVNETENTLYNDSSENGGDLSLTIDVYDWFNADMNSVKVESPSNFDVVLSAIATGGGPGYSTYNIDIIDATPAQGSIDLLISIESDAVGYGGLLPGETVTAYFMHTSDVSGEGPSECNPPTTPTLVDPIYNGYQAVMAVDTNNVIHMAYSDRQELYWSYSEDCGETWTNMGSVATASSGTQISPTSIDLSSGIDEPYVYAVWPEYLYNTTGPRRVKVARMPIDPLGSPLEIITAWDHSSVPVGNYNYSGMQIEVLADNDIMIAGKWKYSHALHYFLAHDFSDFNSATEYSISGAHINGGSITYPYGMFTTSVQSDSSGNCYLVNSGYYDTPLISGTNWGSFILKYDESMDMWDWEYAYHHSGSSMYWDNLTNGLYIDANDDLYYVSEYQTGGSGGYGNDSGTYNLTFNDGVAGGGTYNFIDPIPDLSRTVPSPYTDAKYDYEYLYASAVADSNGLCYIVYQNTYNDMTAYYITYDGATWNHTVSPVKINTTMDAFMPFATRGFEDWVYVSFVDYDGSNASPVYFMGLME